MTRPARVLWLAKGLGRGGAEKLLVTGAAHLDSDRFSVEVAYLLPWKDALVADLEGYGVKAHCLDQRSNRDLRWVPRLRRLVREGGFELVHTHMPVPAVAARLALGRPQPAIVHTEHNVWHRYRKPTYWANALTYRRNDAVIAVSHAVAGSIPDRYRPTGPATTEVLLHGIEMSSVRSGEIARARARELLGLPSDAFVVGTVGNFTPKKDQRSLIEALVRLRRSEPDARAVLIGTGPVEDDLRDLVRRRGLTGAVVFAGSRDDVPDLLPAFDVFCLSSLHEGLSIALVEALAAGVPAVCTRVGGVPEVLRHDVEGLLVQPADPTALAAALASLAADPDRRARYAAAAVERSKAFDIGRAMTRVEEVYDEVLARR